jgi:uracil-DNA glycosylase
MTLPWNLNYWNTGEYQVVREKLDDEIDKGYQINPDRKSMFRALTLTPEKSVRVVIVGQDPYPSHAFATGVAFSIPSDVPAREWPPTLKTFITEYCQDLGYDSPCSGNLEAWSSQGVLLWNAIPSCREGVSLSHDWPGNEWAGCTAEIIERLNPRGIVFAFLGGVARRFADLVQPPSTAILTSHPSPRGSRNSKTPFTGSRLFSTINIKLVSLGLEPIDWRLDGSASKKDVPGSVMGGSRLLANITGADLGGRKGNPQPNLAVSTFEI